MIQDIDKFIVDLQDFLSKYGQACEIQVEEFEVEPNYQMGVNIVEYHAAEVRITMHVENPKSPKGLKSCSVQFPSLFNSSSR